MGCYDHGNEHSGSIECGEFCCQTQLPGVSELVVGSFVRQECWYVVTSVLLPSPVGYLNTGVQFVVVTEMCKVQ